MDVERHLHGTPSWVDLQTPDVDGAARFYGELFGWDVDAPLPETGGYRMCRIRGRTVAGMFGAPEGEPRGPRWSAYITVDDADVSAKAIEASGGTVLEPPFDVMTFGRTAPFTDTEGAQLAIWQAGDTIGTEIIGEHGTLGWIQLDDLQDGPRARRFYGEVFGWEGDDDPYVSFSVGGRPVAGMAEPSSEAEPGSASVLVYFTVDDVDAAAAKVEALGGGVHHRSDAPVFAYCTDPQGVRFCVLEPLG